MQIAVEQPPAARCVDAALQIIDAGGSVVVAEVTYENVTGGRFRHPARFVRWRPDKSPAECTYDQVDQPPPLEFGEIFVEVGADG